MKRNSENGMDAKGPRDGREKINKWKTNGKKSQCMGNMLATLGIGRKHGIGRGVA